MLAQQKKLKAQVRGEVPEEPPPEEKTEPTNNVVHLKDWQVRYYHNDHLGTPRELSRDDGQIVWQATYKAWGNTLKVERPAAEALQKQERLAQAQQAPEAQNDANPELWEAEQNLRFQGQYFDSETGLHYNRFRYFDPDVGRFISQDPIGFEGGFNLYQYAPNPVEWIDPLGLDRYVIIGENQAAVEAYAVAMRKASPCNEFKTIAPDWKK
jgi:RHS repeat-associated protein